MKEEWQVAAAHNKNPRVDWSKIFEISLMSYLNIKFGKDKIENLDKKKLKIYTDNLYEELKKIIIKKLESIHDKDAAQILCVPLDKALENLKIDISSEKTSYLTAYNKISSKDKNEFSITDRNKVIKRILKNNSQIGEINVIDKEIRLQSAIFEYNNSLSIEDKLIELLEDSITIEKYTIIWRAYYRTDKSKIYKFKCPLSFYMKDNKISTRLALNSSKINKNQVFVDIKYMEKLQ